MGEPSFASWTLVDGETGIPSEEKNVLKYSMKVWIFVRFVLVTHTAPTISQSGWWPQCHLQVYQVGSVQGMPTY